MRITNENRQEVEAKLLRGDLFWAKLTDINCDNALSERDIKPGDMLEVDKTLKANVGDIVLKADGKFGIYTESDNVEGVITEHGLITQERIREYFRKNPDYKIVTTH